MQLIHVDAIWSPGVISYSLCSDVDSMLSRWSSWSPGGLLLDSRWILDKKLAGLPPKKKCLNSTVLYTPTACPTDSDGLSSDPAISDGLSGQSVGSPSEFVEHDWIPLLVQPKSSESPLRPPKSKKWLDWPEFCVCWTSAGLPLDFTGFLMD